MKHSAEKLCKQWSPSSLHHSWFRGEECFSLSFPFDSFVLSSPNHRMQDLHVSKKQTIPKDQWSCPCDNSHSSQTMSQPFKLLRRYLSFEVSQDLENKISAKIRYFPKRYFPAAAKFFFEKKKAFSVISKN